MAAGMDHTILLLDDGTAVAFGNNWNGQCDIPRLPAGASYIQAAAGCRHSVLLRNDGTVVACGDNQWGQCDIPQRAENDGETYTQVAAGDLCTILLSSDGMAFYIGIEGPWLVDFVHPNGHSINIVDMTAGAPNPNPPDHSRHGFVGDDGSVLSCTGNTLEDDWLCPAPGTKFLKVATSPSGLEGPSMICLRSDGRVVAQGYNRFGHLTIPAVEDGCAYIEVSTSGVHSVLLRSDGQAVACGYNRDGQCDVPDLAEGLRYVHVAAGGSHTVFWRSDGTAVAVGDNNRGQCNLQPLLSNTRPPSFQPDLIVQVTMYMWDEEAVTAAVEVHTMGAVLIYRWLVRYRLLIAGLELGATTFRASVAQHVRPQGRRMFVVLPDGSRLDRDWTWVQVLSQFEPTRPWFDSLRS